MAREVPSGHVRREESWPHCVLEQWFLKNHRVYFSMCVFLIQFLWAVVELAITPELLHSPVLDVCAPMIHKDLQSGGVQEVAFYVIPQINKLWCWLGHTIGIEDGAPGRDTGFYSQTEKLVVSEEIRGWGLLQAVIEHRCYTWV